MENMEMNDIKITDEYVYERISVDVIQEIKHFNYNGIEGEYIKENSVYGTNKYLDYGDLTAVTTRSGKWIVDGSLTDELASAFNLAFKENFKAKEGITILSYNEERRDTDYVTSIWHIFYKDKYGLIEVEYNYGNGGHPEYLRFSLGEISGFITETMADVSKDIQADVIKRIEDITKYPIQERIQ